MISFELLGIDKLLMKLGIAASPATAAAVAGPLYREAQGILSDSQPLVPVEFGTLKGSGHVTMPTVSIHGVEVTIGYGGAARDYAIIQHERLDFQHPRGGQAKYLEQPALEHGATMGERLGPEFGKVIEVEMRL